MMKRKIQLLFILLLAFQSNTIYAQESNDSVSISFDPYASFRGYLGASNNKLELSENVSRIGAKFKVTRKNISFIAASELHLNLFNGGQNFNVDGNPTGAFLDITTSNDTKTFTNRLGYIGFEIDKFGTVTFGKQWSVYYDITSYTDQYYVFGGTASATYVGGTDGGASGTGRADNAIIYRNNFGKLYIGAQTQAGSNTSKSFIDGYGFSAQYKLNDELSFGGAFNKSIINKDLISERKIIGLTGYPTYYAAGVKYTGERLTFNVVGAVQKNGDFTQGQYYNSMQELVQPTVVFDAKGLEIYSKYKFNKFAVHGGYILYKPDAKKVPEEYDQRVLSPNYEINNVIFGFTYNPFPFISIYNEQRISFGRNPLGMKEKSVFTLGMNLNFSKNLKTKTYIKP